MNRVISKIIDTDINARITPSDSIAFDIRKNRFLEVTLFSPKLVRYKGKKVKSTKGKFYVYVIRCPKLAVNGLEVQKGPREVYLAVVSKQKRIYRLPDSIRTTANFLKGVVDNADSMVKFYKEQLLINKKDADSLVKLMKKSNYPGLFVYSQFQKMDEFMSTDWYYYHFFRIFRYAKRKKKLPEFFLSPYYNQRFLHTNINKMPYGLPKVEPDTLAPKPTFFAILFGSKNEKTEDTSATSPQQLELKDWQSEKHAIPKQKKTSSPNGRNQKESEKKSKKEEVSPSPTFPTDLENLPQQ
ncbi:MAG: hypothetical protein NZ576_09720 [Bacteroidia bacterium]|nr:hypothetical protein [Bacteroidia bacterium]